MKQLVIAAIAIILITGAAQGIVHYNDGGEWEISTEIDNSVHVDEGPAYADAKTTVNIVEGGSIPVNEPKFNQVNAYNQSTLIVSGGSVGYRLNGYDNSTVNISDGSVFAVYGHGDSNVTISGGNINSAFAGETSHINIFGGNIGSLNARGNATVVISGGNVDGLMAASCHEIVFWAKEFTLGDGLVLDENRLLGTGILSGQWLNGITWQTQIDQPDFSTATILLIPEPATVMLLGLGGLALLKRKK